MNRAERDAIEELLWAIADTRLELVDAMEFLHRNCPYEAEKRLQAALTALTKVKATAILYRWRECPDTARALLDKDHRWISAFLRREHGA